MKNMVTAFVLLISPILLIAQNTSKLSSDRILSFVNSSHSDNIVLKQSFEIDVPLDSVWNAYTTETGWEK